MPSNKRKTILSALVIISGGKKEYRDLMMNDIGDYRREIEKQEKTPAQEKAWTSQEEILSKYKQLEKVAVPLMRKGNLTNSEKQKVQDFVILALLGGLHIAPRRSKDYVDFKLRNAADDDNYISDNKKQLVFNSYKTSKSYGKQTVPLPTKLRNILNRWAQVNDSDYLLIDSKGQPLGNGNKESQSGSVKLNQRLEKMFNKKVGVNGLRHSFLTDKYQETEEQKREKKEKEKVMADMGSSVNMIKTYVKED
jgi:integrase